MHEFVAARQITSLRGASVVIKGFETRHEQRTG